jgi:uncharacterized protein
VSSFDDEFGLFGEEVVEEEERRPSLGARKIATGETIIDEIEPEEDVPQRRRGGGGRRIQPAPEDPTKPEGVRRWRRGTEHRPPIAREVAYPRAAELLEFLAKGLVAKPEAVVVELHPDAKGAVLELEVDPDDLGKVIGRGGRVAQALRTLVRAGAEGRVTIDIVDADEEYEDDEAGGDVAEEDDETGAEDEAGGGGEAERDEG